MRSKSKKTLICFDSAYSLSAYEAGSLQIFQEGKLLDGYFDKLYVVNIASNINNPDSVGRSKLIKVSERIEYLDVPLGRFRSLKSFMKINFLFSIFSSVLLAVRLCKKNDVSFIRGENPQVNGLLALLVSKLTRIPLFIGVWGNPAELRDDTDSPMYPKLLKFIAIEVFIEKLVLKSADRVLVQNKNNKNFVMNYLKSDKNIRLFRVSNQIDDIHYIDPKLREKPDNFFHEFELLGQRKMLIISRLEKQKRVLDAIKVISYLVNVQSILVDLFICGVGPEEEYLKKYAIENGVIDNIHFCGMRDQLWLSTAIPLMDLCISPITGRALVEVALGGIPVVGYDRDWQTELIEHDITGYICNFNDVKALSYFSYVALQNREKAINMGYELRHRALNIFNKDLALETEKSCYDEFLN
jgi:glycosyltransferase involved in cell wall biosynthesis